MGRKTKSQEVLRAAIMSGYGQHKPAAGELDYIDRHLDRYVTTMGFLPKTPGNLLDVGSFPEHMSLLAKAQGWSVTGISKLDGIFVGADFAARMRQNDIAILDVDMERGTIPVASETFDCVFFNEIIEHLPYNPFHALIRFGGY